MTTAFTESRSPHLPANHPLLVEKVLARENSWRAQRKTRRFGRAIISATSLAILILLLILVLTGCSSMSDSTHQAHVDALRARLPYIARIGNTRSMDTVLDAGQMRLVESKPYDKLQTGNVVVFWPAGYRCPVAHFIGRRIGTDAWDTHGMEHGSDLTNGLGFLLTRENYIGIIK